MRMSSADRTRWVIQDVDEDTVQVVRELATRHRVRNGEVLDVAVRLLDEQLGTTIGLPEGWSKPRGW